MIAIFLNKYLSTRKERSIPGCGLIKDIENKKDEWLSEIPDYSLDMGDKPIIYNKVTLSAKIGKDK